MGLAAEAFPAFGSTSRLFHLKAEVLKVRVDRKNERKRVGECVKSSF
jgi:hypothetical protein